jgi:CO/xanthine dehydrogenase Mo-binding subunit
MTTATRDKIIGDPVDRVDGPLKVTGAAPYPSDFTLPDLAHAVLVQSTIAAGIIRGIDAAAAEATPGVLAVITHENTPALAEAPVGPLGPPAPFPLRDNRILHHGQHVAVVVAWTREQALEAARLVEIDYEQASPVLSIDDPGAPVLVNKWGQDVDRGDVTAALASAEVVYDQIFTTAPVTNNPMGLFATVARWEGNRLTVHDASQDPMLVRKTLATVFDLPETGVRVLVPYLGGGFGAGLRVWPHVILTALAARVVGRPVKLVLTRPQMFTSVGHRPQTRQRVRLGATRDGRLVAVDHESIATIGALDDGGVEPVTQTTGNAYSCPNVATHDRRARLHIPSPHWMRAPGAAQGNFAMESALDELSYTLRIDPIELRLLVQTLVDVVADDESSPLRGRRADEVTTTEGGIHVTGAPSIGETYAGLLARHGLPEVTAHGERDPRVNGASQPPSGSFAARFAEVRVDPELGLLRVTRIVSALDAGRILNEKLARSQMIGGAVMGIGMTMLEETVFDHATGRIANATFGDYLIPAHADVPDLDVVFVGAPDTVRPIGIKGIGEIAIVGVSAAIANAVYHATGRRIRSLPITVEQLL